MSVTFNYQTFVAQFPELSGVTELAATALFNRAVLMQPGLEVRVVDSDRLLALYNLLTAHFVALYTPQDGQGNYVTGGIGGARPFVGRISSATEGSVTVSVEYGDGGSPSEAWFTQTPYGAEYWQATAGFRAARYIPSPRPPLASVYPYPYARRWGR